jgi:hypothetical protein
LIELKAYYDIVPENISTKLYLYKNYNLYDDILYINKEQINNFKKIDNKYLLSFLEKNQLGCWGIGSDKNNLDFNLIRVILKSYFNFTDSVKNRANKIIKKYNINLNNSNFIYKKRDYFGPVDISKISIKILNQRGGIVNLLQDEFSFSLEVTTIYDVKKPFMISNFTEFV